MRIAVDAMGGDYAPDAVIAGVVEAAKVDEGELILVGDESVLRPKLAAYPSDSRISIVHASQVIHMGESPVAAIKQKKDSSINVGLRLVNEGNAEAFVSAGNTGAVMSASIFGLGRVEGIERPAFAGVWPSLKGDLVILDVGANSECRPKQLYQFAHLGSIFAERVLGIAKPVVGLLNIGQEDQKGTETVIEALEMLKKSKLNFVGNVESSQVFNGDVHVFVCDGFVGNMLLKFAEGMMHFTYELFKNEVKKRTVAKLGALLMKPAFMAVQKRTHYDEHGGALLLGVKGVCVKAHGRSNSKAIRNAIQVARKSVSARIVDEFAGIA